jgi:hypothetical protein
MRTEEPLPTRFSISQSFNEKLRCLPVFKIPKPVLARMHRRKQDSVDDVCNVNYDISMIALDFGESVDGGGVELR